MNVVVGPLKNKEVSGTTSRKCQPTRKWGSRGGLRGEPVKHQKSLRREGERAARQSITKRWFQQSQSTDAKESTESGKEARAFAQPLSGLKGAALYIPPQSPEKSKLTKLQMNPPSNHKYLTGLDGGEGLGVKNTGSFKEQG